MSNYFHEDGSINFDEAMHSEDYWVPEMHGELVEHILQFMNDNHMNKAQFAEHIGTSRSYVSQLLNLEQDLRVSTLVRLYLKLDLAPPVNPMPLNDAIRDKKKNAYTAQLLQASMNASLITNYVVETPVCEKPSWKSEERSSRPDFYWLTRSSIVMDDDPMKTSEPIQRHQHVA